MDGERMVPVEGLLRDRGDIGRATTRRPRTARWLVTVGLLLAVVLGGLYGFNRFREQAIATYFASNKPPPAQVSAAEVNTEAVPRLYRAVRSGARYQRTLDLLANVKKIDPKMTSKTGLMVGIGESTDELLQVFRDLAERKVDILTVGQYLRPSRDHLPIARMYTPDEFRFLKDEAMKMGFKHVESGPLVRSSYHAHEQAESTYAAQTK